MELRESLRMLRSELGMTQSEFANAVNVGFTAASRWENKNTRPNRLSSIAILKLAKKHSISPVCLNNLTEILLASRADDKAEKEKIAQVKERLQLEERLILTDEVMRTMLDNIDIAVIGYRVFFSSPDETKIIYSNRKYAEIFGYSIEEFNEKSKTNMYFSVPQESVQAYKEQVKQLLEDKIQINEFSLINKGFRSDKSEMWLEIKGISLKKFSYGWDFYLSCRDISARIEAQRKYAEEIAIRDATLQSIFASIHLGLVTNKVFRQKDTEKLTGYKFLDQNVDNLLNQLADGIQINNRKAFQGMFNRENLTKAFNEGNLFSNMICFNTICNKWVRYTYALVKNPYTNNLEAMIYVYDIHAQVIATKIMNLLANQNFDYIGVINNQNGMFESLYYSPTVYKFTMSGERNYQDTIEQKLINYAREQHRETQREAVSLKTIREMLAKSDSYSTTLHLLDYDKIDFTAKITYRYLDETKTNIVMAQYKKNIDSESILGKVEI